MYIYVDKEGKPTKGYLWVRELESAKRYINSGQVEKISIGGEIGYELIKWVKEEKEKKLSIMGVTVHEEEDVLRLKIEEELNRRKKD